MTKRRIHIETIGARTVKVFRLAEYDEYQVRLYINGALHTGADYFTGDKADAIDTACAMVQPEKPRAPDKPLCRAYNVAVLHICNAILPRGFEVSANAPQNYAELRAHFQSTGKICVWSGASDNTIFADKEVNYAFRAWHDAKHITGNFDFSFTGEFDAYMAQCADISAIYDGSNSIKFRAITFAEIIGQRLYSDKFGGFPLDQYGFVKSYLEMVFNPMGFHNAAIDSRFGISNEEGV